MFPDLGLKFLCIPRSLRLPDVRLVLRLYFTDVLWMINLQTCKNHSCLIRDYPVINFSTLNMDYHLTEIHWATRQSTVAKLIESYLFISMGQTWACNLVSLQQHSRYPERESDLTCLKQRCQVLWREWFLSIACKWSFHWLVNAVA